MPGTAAPLRPSLVAEYEEPGRRRARDHTLRRKTRGAPVVRHECTEAERRGGTHRDDECRREEDDESSASTRPESGGAIEHVVPVGRPAYCRQSATEVEAIEVAHALTSCNR